MQKWTVVKGNDIKNKAKNASVVFEERKMQICIIVFIAEETCSWLSSFHEQTASPFCPPTKVTALLSRSKLPFPLGIWTSI